MWRLIAILAFLLVAAVAGIMLQQYDFPITAHLSDEYIVRTSSARIAIMLVFLLTIIFGIAKFLVWAKNSPGRFLRRKKREGELQAYRDILGGFSALAEGDPEKAKKLAKKSSRTLPEQPLVKLLQAQAANSLNEKEEAEKYYLELTGTEEGRFIGYRGLIAQAIAENQFDKAIKIADDLLKTNPKSHWLNEALIDLGFRTRDWDKLERYLKKAEANKIMDKPSVSERFAVYYYMKARIAKKDGRIEDAEWLAERSLKYKDDFLPAAIFLAAHYVEFEKYKNAVIVIRDIWPKATHPSLMNSFDLAISNSGERTRSKKVRKLYELNPDDSESAAYYAKTLIDERENEEARKIIMHGLKIRETKSLCRLMAQIDDKVAWTNRSESALEDKCWHCRITGARYPEWQLYSDSGELNTIIWNFPPESARVAFSENRFLLNY